MISTTNINQVRKQIQELKKQKDKDKQQIIVQAQSPEFNRKLFENPDIDIITDLETHNRKDYMKQRDSGLNEILCKLATKNNIKIGINLKQITKQPLKIKATLLSRIRQNIQLCKRTNTKIIILGNYPKQNIMSFMQTLGASTKQAKQAISSGTELAKQIE